MAETKTKKTQASVDEFLAAIDDETKQGDARALVRLLKKVTGEKPTMWGSSIVGFGQYHYRYASGREGDSMLVGFSPRAQNLTLYFPAGFDKLTPLLKKLGKFSTGKGCLHVKRMDDVDMSVLEAIVRQAVKEAKAVDAKNA